MIAVIDYGAGNLRSVANAFETIGCPCRLTENPSELKHASAIVLPGVGAFGDAMRKLGQSGMITALQDEVLGRKKPYLGICLGLQLLAESSLEQGEHEGFGWLKGRVERLNPDRPAFRVPHIGWNDIEIRTPCGLFESLADKAIFYFVHSYHLVPESCDDDWISATCNHGQTVTAAVQKDNIFAVQFHPEKSQQAGLALLKNFVDYTSRTRQPC